MRKIVPVFFIIILGILMYWDPGENLFTPNAFNNSGDACFPLNINFVNSFLYSWDSRGNFGLGQANTCPIVLPMYFCAWLWSILSLPLWIANRLWHILPNIFIGLGAFYLYRSLFNSKYSWICGTIASAFIMLLPDRNIFPHGSMGFAGTLFILGALIRGLFSENTGSSRKYTAIIFSLGVAAAIHYLRCLYISFIIVGLVTILSIFYYRWKRKRYISIIKYIGFCVVLTLLFNLYWILPMILQLTQGTGSLWSNVEIMEVRKIFQLAHQSMTNPVYTLRATTGGAGSGVPSYYYFSHPLILAFTFLIPIFCFLPLLLRNVAKKIRILALFSILLSFYPASFHFSPDLNMFLRNHIPTFWIMNNPHYWHLYLGACYGLIIGAMTEHFLFLLGDRKARKAIFVSCVSIVVIIFGGGILLDRALVPGFYNRYALYGNKFPFVKIPDEYDELEEYLAENARNGDRVWHIDTGGFMRYKWSYEGHMPEFLFFKSPITTVGRGMSFVSPMIDLLSDSVDSKKYAPEEGLNLAWHMSKIMNIRYIFVHKDYFDGKDIEGREIEGVHIEQRDIDLTNYARKIIAKNSNFKVVMDTDSFILYENKDPSLNLIYPVKDAALVVGDLDILSLIAQNRAYIEKPLFLFGEQIQNRKDEIQNIGIDNIVFKENNLQGLPVETDKKIKIILVNRREKEKEEKLIWQKIDQSEAEVWYIFSQDMEFYIPQDGDYNIKAKVSASLVEKNVKDEIGSEFRFGTEKELKDWVIHPLEVSYDYSFSEDGVLTLFSYFDGDDKEDEFVHMRNIKARVDLEKYPYFDLTYKIEDPEVQTIEVVAGVDFDKDGVVNHYFRGIYQRQRSALKEWTDFSCNLYSLAKEGFPDKKHYDLICLELFPHKLWGVDCSSPEKRGEYRFWIQKLQFYNVAPRRFFKVFEDALNVKMDSAEEIKKWAIEYKPGNYLLENGDLALAVTRHMSYLELSRYIDKVALKRFPLVELEYSAGASSFQNVEFILGIDFDGDGIADEDVFAGSLSFTNELNKFQADAYETVQRNFPDKPEYYLTQIKLRINSFRPIDELSQKMDLFYIRGLRIYSYHLAPCTDFKFHKPIIKLDGEKYWISRKVKNEKDAKGLLFEQIVHLEKGKHCLKKLTGEGFEVEWVVLEPEDRGQKVEDRNEPNITFKKINPSKYEVQVLGAKEPFWLVLSESFHEKWKVFLKSNTEKIKKGGIQEDKNKMRFTPEDIKYLFKKPLDAEHQVVNGYANGWYIDPKELNLGENFTLDIYFQPQSLFYIGLGVSGLTFLGFIGFIGVGSLRNRRKKYNENWL